MNNLRMTTVRISRSTCSDGNIAECNQSCWEIKTSYIHIDKIRL